MDDFQARLIRLSAPLVRSFSFLRSMTTALIYTVIVSLTYFLIQQAYDWRLQIFIVLLSFGYVFAKDLTMERQTVKIMHSQAQYLKTKRPLLVTYVPLMEKVGPYVLLKRAALYFTDTWLFMEAFNQNRSGKTPTDSLQIAYGKHFSIQSIDSNLDGKLLVFQATLMDKPYRFVTCNDPELLLAMNKIIETPQGE
jgi:hypothetical protein